MYCIANYVVYLKVAERVNLIRRRKTKYKKKLQLCMVIHANQT